MRSGVNTPRCHMKDLRRSVESSGVERALHIVGGAEIEVAKSHERGVHRIRRSASHEADDPLLRALAVSAQRAPGIGEGPRAHFSAPAIKPARMRR
jgi:hypothetical protein